MLSRSHILGRRGLLQTARRPLASNLRPPQSATLAASFHQSPSPRQQQQKDPQTSHLLPEFSLRDRVIVVSGAARGLGLCQAEALLEAGAVVHALDRLPEPGADSDFARIAERARTELASSASSNSQRAGEGRLHYHRVDVRDQEALGKIVGGIAEREGRLDGLIAAAGIQQETPALEYTAEDCDKMMGVNVTGVFMTAQAVAREMIRRKQKGSLVLIASMSGTVANRGLICP
jgi:NAD(P)-dependent dehydrogenase (short-subunit alcohol dehydrogenase family)